MKIKSARDFWSGLMFVVVGIVFAVGATNYRMGPACPPNDACTSSLYARFTQLSAHPGAGYFPLGLSLVLIVLGAVVLFKALTIESEDGDPIGPIAARPLLLVVISVAVFGLLLESFGLYIAAGVSIAVAMTADRATAPLTVLYGGAAGTLLSFLLVEYVARWLGLGVASLTASLGGSSVARVAIFLGQLLARLLPMAALVLALLQVRGKLKPVATVTILFFVLLSGSVWIFVQGLALTIPLRPTLAIFQ